jgi:ATP-dependent Clp protease protease subunit
MREISSPVNAHAIGFCYSSCAMILAAATGRRTSTPNTILMVHANLEESNGVHSFERLARERYEHLWRTHAHLPERWFPMTGDDEYYLSPAKALEYGIIDEITTPRDGARRPQ